MASVLSHLQERHLIAGVGAHSLETLRAVERAGLEPDFCFKTFNNLDFCAEQPEEVTEFMRTVARPWIAFKVLGAGAVAAAGWFSPGLDGGSGFPDGGHV